MRMSDSYPNSRGFTLLELLVVLGLISLVTAVAMPGLVNLFESVSRNVTINKIGADINGLGRRAYETGTPITLSKAAVDLPDGWVLTTPMPVVYSAQGACRGGSVVLKVDGELVRKFLLKAPFCRIGDDA